MKRILILLMILSIVVSGILIVFSNNIKNTFNLEKPEVLQKLQVNPIAYMVEGDQPFNFMYPYYNEIESFYADDTVALWNGIDPITIRIDGPYTEDIAYAIIDPLSGTELQRDILTKSDIVSFENGMTINISPEALEKDKRYILNIEAKVEGRKVDFYQGILISDSSQQALLETLRAAHTLMYQGDNNYKQYIKGNNSGGAFYDANQNSTEDVLTWHTIKDFVKMNEPIPEILFYDPNTGNFQVKLQFVVAMRKAYDFEYWDFVETYSGYIDQGNVTFTQYERKANKKNQPYFDNESLQWVLDEGYNREEASSILSENGSYIAFVYKNEVWLLNKNYNELTKVFGFDTLDSDYIMDEGNQHRIKLLELDNKGNMKYLVYGYMAAGDFAGYNGILINEYQHKKLENESLLFVKLSKDYHVLEYYIEHASYYNDDNHLLYLALQMGLYEINVKEGSFKQVMELSDYMHLSTDGLLYANNLDNKENLSIQFINLMSNRIDEDGEQILLENTYIRAIDTTKEGLIIGAYHLQNTYEYLNGRVFYPYHSVYLVEPSGKITQLAQADDKSYFQDLIINKQTGVMSASIYYLDKKGSKVMYKKTDERTIYQFESIQNVTEKVVVNEVINNQNTIRLSHSSTSLDEENVPIASNIHKKYVMLDTHLSLDRIIYEAYSGNELVGVSSELKEGLNSNSKSVTRLFSVNKGVRKLIYDQSTLPNTIMIDIPIMAQRPELIRGCESTALAMFLSHYTDREISKIEVAEKLRRDETPKTTVNGMISFGDMNKGFVGSMTDRVQPGLGAYVEPVYDVAKEYVEGVYNITGVSFEQILNFVGDGQPVWVITPANYNKVSEYVIQHWITPSGYMEVTYLEHSVVIVGYDETYVYLNDPQQGRIIKQPRISFQIGWENQGSQALVVLQ